MADSELSDLTALDGDDVETADLLYVVHDVDGTPVDRKISITEFIVAILANGLQAALDAKQALRPFKRTIRRGLGNITSLNATSFTPIDSTNLGYLTLDLAIGDVVRCEFQAEGFMDASNAVGLDVEVDQPTSANVFVGGGNDYGVHNLQLTTVRAPVTFFAYFTATEAGVHGFRPCYRVSGGNMTLGNATSGTSETDITWAVLRLGAPLA